jgi:hypothetical protein
LTRCVLFHKIMTIIFKKHGAPEVKICFNPKILE